MNRTALELPEIKPRTKSKPNTPKEADAVAAEHGFTSRETASTSKAPRRRSNATAFDATIGIRCTKADKARFNRLADKRGWPAGKLFSEMLKLYQSSNH